MSLKKRRSLDDSLGREFVFGDRDAAGSEPVVEERTEATCDEDAAAVSSDDEGEEAKRVSKGRSDATARREPLRERTPRPSVVAKVDVMSQLELPPKEATKRFTVDLSETLHRKLSILAAQTGRTKADIVRMLLADALDGV